MESCLNRIASIAKSPRIFVESLAKPSFRRKADQAFANFVHRFNPGCDLLELFTLLTRSWALHGSLGAHFLTYLRADDLTIERALAQLIKQWKAWAPSDASRSLFYLLNSPDDGSCCKRWCLFLRWMGRRDHLDPGPLDHPAQGHAFTSSTTYLFDASSACHATGYSYRPDLSVLGSES